MSIKKVINLNEISFEEKVILFIYEDWSEFTKEGLKILQEVKENTPKNIGITFQQISLTNTPKEISDWLKTQNGKKVNFIPAIGTGNGSLLWIKKGEIIDFILSAYLSGQNEILTKTTVNFGLNQK